MSLYPLRFAPIFKYRIWGGEKLRHHLSKQCTGDSIGESWEISDVPGDETLVTEGPLQGKSLRELIAEYGADLMGQSVIDRFGEEFPLLIKFIDARTPLSIQVHPSDEVAKAKHQSFGKNEMWYVMQADPEASLLVGFDQLLTPDEFEKRIKTNQVLEVMHRETVVEGDTFYIPTGRVHAIGAGVLLAEIQQTSDITYRIYDYDRVDPATGTKRDLHMDQALEVIDFKVHEQYKTSYSTEVNQKNLLVKSPYFETFMLSVSGTVALDLTQRDSFTLLIGVGGEASVHTPSGVYSINCGETLLLPAVIDKVQLVGDQAKVLSVVV
ncbi:MAG: type I phosphomannose isomerase catalytic subunit [Flavobacteriaceae bacterium]